MNKGLPVINIEFDDAKVGKADVLALSKAIQKIVSEATKIEDVFVYANSSQIKVEVAPIEIFVEMSASKVPDKEALFQVIKEPLVKWKKENNFKHPITITLTPVDWKFEVDI